MILERVRAIVGPEIPVLATLDLHAKISKRMVDNGACGALRTNPLSTCERAPNARGDARDARGAKADAGFVSCRSHALGRAEHKTGYADISPRPVEWNARVRMFGVTDVAGTR